MSELGDYTNSKETAAAGGLERLMGKSCLLASDFLDDVESEPL